MVLCDGECGLAFHECCVYPRVVALEMGEEEGWLCPACETKVCVCVCAHARAQTHMRVCQ